MVNGVFKFLKSFFNTNIIFASHNCLYRQINIEPKNNTSQIIHHKSDIINQT